MNTHTKTLSVVTLPLSAAVDEFLRVGLPNHAASTVNWYRHRLASLIAGGIDLVCVPADLQRWYSGLPAGLSPYTLHGYVRAVRRFFRWLHEMGVISDNPAARLRFPRLPAVGRRGVADADARAMLAAAEVHHRDYALLCFFWSTGCRLSGASNLRVSDLDLERGQAVVIEKFKKGRVVFVDERCSLAIAAWLRVRDVRSDWVFSTDGGAQLAARSVYGRFALYAHLAGVANHWNPHEWRHSFGRRMSESGMPLGILSQIMGHASVDVTIRHYGMFASKELHEQYKRYHRM